MSFEFVTLTYQENEPVDDGAGGVVNAWVTKATVSARKHRYSRVSEERAAAFGGPGSPGVVNVNDNFFVLRAPLPSVTLKPKIGRLVQADGTANLINFVRPYDWTEQVDTVTYS